ncbi:hypothetical protein RIF29_32554 [Crotalaria pallida]|uniref:Uncharacterized protein n=1 Tax=Crotalaria pallida TaxID=3830 RepID=A0AAN9EID5_CROPI
MDGLRKHQVSLRGASAKEITRDDLLQKVSRERELRNYAKRVAAAALFIQSVEALRGYEDGWSKVLARVGDNGDQYTGVRSQSSVSLDMKIFHHGIDVD